MIARRVQSRSVITASLLAIAAVATLGGAYLWSLRPHNFQTPAASERVRIAAVAYIGSCPILMAHAKGYLADEGIAAEFHYAENGKAALQETLQGIADIATTADIPIMYAAVQGKPVSVVATMTTMEDNAIIARKDRGIGTAASLKGKRIGMTVGTTTQFFLGAFLTRERLSPADVTEIDMKPTELIKAIERGDIDAVVLYQPFLDRSAAVLGDNAVILPGSAVYDVLFNLATTQSYVSQNAKTIEKILRASIRGAQVCKEQPSEAIPVVATIMKADREMVRRLWPKYQFEIGLRQGLLLTLEDEARWAIRNKLVTDPVSPNFLTNLGLAPLQAVMPSAVTVIH
jgi:NitT/TauT family transport system substrate-binding protein